MIWPLLPVLSLQRIRRRIGAFKSLLGRRNSLNLCEPSNKSTLNSLGSL